MGGVCCGSRLVEVDNGPVTSECAEDKDLDVVFKSPREIKVEPVKPSPREIKSGPEEVKREISFVEEDTIIEARVKKSPKYKPCIQVKDVYKFGKILGTGGFSIVKQVTHRKTFKHFACKIMNLPEVGAASTDEESSRADIFKEIEILCAMEHDNVIRLFEFYEEDHKVFLITELISGGELLDAVLERGNYSEADACNCFRQLIEGIGYLHSKGIVHRDLKLENLMLETSSDMTNIKIVDFGLAKNNGLSNRKMGTVCGTPQYVAPEVIKSPALTASYGPAVDMWGAGVILFILLGGYPPFHHENESVMFNQIRNGIFTFDEEVWVTISPTAKDLITKLLTIDPSKRLTAEKCLEHPWFSTQPSVEPLSTTTENLKNNYRLQFRKAVNVVLTINKMKRLAIMEDESDA